MKRHYLLILVILSLFATLFPVAAQSSGYDLGLLTVDLPEGWIGQVDLPVGLLFGADETSVTHIQAVMQPTYAALTGKQADSSDRPTPPESYAGGYVFILDKTIAINMHLSFDELIHQFPAAVQLTVDGREALYFVNPSNEADGKLVEYAGVINDGDHTILLFAAGTSDLTSTEQFTTILSSARFAPPAAEPTAAQPAVNAQPVQPGTFSTATLTGSESLRDYPDSRVWAVSPDASRLAYANPDGVCVLTFAEGGGAGDSVCTPIPLQRSFIPKALTWSPDSLYVAFHEDATTQMVDSDIWVLDVVASEVRNMTPDGYEGSFFPFSKATKQGVSSLGVDITPVWSGDTLYFFRTTYSENQPFPTALYRVNVVNWAEAEKVADLSSETEEMFGVFTSINANDLAGVASVSSSGRWLAAILRPRKLENAQIILFDLENGTLQRKDGIGAFSAGLPAFAADTHMTFFGLDWLADDSGLLVSVGSFDPSLSVNNLYQYDLESGAVQPLLDLSAISSQDDMQANDALPTFLNPRQSALLPDRSGLIWAGRLRAEIALWSVPLPLTGTPYTPDSLPAAIGRLDSPPAPSTITIGEGNGQIRMLVGGTLLTFTRAE